MHGPGPITYQQIEAWGRLTGRAPDVLEVEAIMSLDAVWRAPEDAK